MHSGLILAKADPRPIYLQIIEQVRQRMTDIIHRNLRLPVYLRLERK